MFFSQVRRLVLTRSEKSTATHVGFRVDANEGAAGAGARESVLLGSMVAVTESTEFLLLLPVDPQCSPAEKDGERAFAAVVEETVAALLGSRLVFSCSSFYFLLMGIFV